MFTTKSYAAHNATHDLSPHTFKRQEPEARNIDSIVAPRRILAGSLIGGIAETQEMLDFCAKHNITSDIEIIPIQDVKYRFVIDMSSLS